MCFIYSIYINILDIPNKTFEEFFFWKWRLFHINRYFIRIKKKNKNALIEIVKWRVLIAFLKSENKNHLADLRKIDSNFNI